MKKLISTCHLHRVITLFIAFFVSLGVSAKDYLLSSPDKQITVTIVADKDKPLAWSVSSQQKSLLAPSRIGMEVIGEKEVFGVAPVVKKVSQREVNQVIDVVVPVKNKQIKDHYNELVMVFKDNYTVSFRAYNNGVAYRIETNLKKDIQVKNELIEFNFADDCLTYWPESDFPDYYCHYEAFFEQLKLSQVSNAKYGYPPLYVAAPSGPKMVVMEADLYDYPNMFLWGTGTSSLTVQFPPFVLKAELDKKSKRPDRLEIFTEKAPYIAATKGKRTFPWRLLIISPDDKGLLENELVYQLSTPFSSVRLPMGPDIQVDPRTVSHVTEENNTQGKSNPKKTVSVNETSWIKPGKVAWDWWNANNIYGVDFPSGVNTETYKYYIDFASEYGLEYIILDEGWSKATTNIKEPNADIDVPELVRYGKTKNVEVILWALWNSLDKDIEGTLDIYTQWGVKGIKVDFMQRADQYMVNFYERVAKACWDRKLLVDFHGSYKPVGLNRKYPNVISYEGVRGLENDKWGERITPAHDIVLPFTRMVAGPMDYTPGATKNASQKGFYANFDEPMSQGTRAHQAAMYALYESPLQMLADNPSNYYKTPDFTRFISRFPSTWDQTIALEGKIGEYIIMARKNGDNWYIGAMTDWTPRSFDITLDFPDGNRYTMEILKDGINAEHYPADFKIEKTTVSKGQKIQLKMASGGGWAAILTPVK